MVVRLAAGPTGDPAGGPGSDGGYAVAGGGAGTLKVSVAGVWPPAATWTLPRYSSMAEFCNTTRRTWLLPAVE
jgi:hypothetical protein